MRDKTNGRKLRNAGSRCMADRYRDDSASSAVSVRLLVYRRIEHAARDLRYKLVGRESRLTPPASARQATLAPVEVAGPFRPPSCLVGGTCRGVEEQARRGGRLQVGRNLGWTYRRDGQHESSFALPQARLQTPGVACRVCDQQRDSLFVRDEEGLCRTTGSASVKKARPAVRTHGRHSSLFQRRVRPQ